jgi:hypothetical protein
MNAEADSGFGSESISSRFPGGFDFSEFEEHDAPWRSDLYPATFGRRGAANFNSQATWTSSPLAERLGLKIVDLRDWCSPVRDQGFLDSCTAFAVVALREFLMNRARQPLVELSPRFLWYIGREQANNQDENTGLTPRDALHALLHGGCSPEQYDPYPPEAYLRITRDQVNEHAAAQADSAYVSLPEFVAMYRRAWAKATTLNKLRETASREPTLDAVYAAKRFTISGYHAIFLDDKAEQATRRYYAATEQSGSDGGQRTAELTAADLQIVDMDPKSQELNRTDPRHALVQIKESLELGYGLILAGNVEAAFVDPDVTATGVLPDLTDAQLRNPLSSHCLFVAGYIELGDGTDGYLICKNSLGPSWGDRGYAYLPFSYFKTRGAVLEVWTAQA